uniref:Uncharacterized protein n=1 Tax=Arundo donax TaxID=35708 RepID=A0A0A9GZT0_ARUDO
MILIMSINFLLFNANLPRQR